MHLTIGAVLQTSEARLKPVSGSARLDAELLLAHSLQVGRAYLFAHAEDPVPASCLLQFQNLLERRVRQEPVAYLLGQQGFWTLSLHVDPAVLVPRPETEHLVEQALVVCQHPSAAVLDLGTGSGAIALALATERPGWRITAVDKSGPALRLAARNRDEYGLVQVTLLQGDWFEPIGHACFDLIVSNPPYIAEHDTHLSGPGLAHEPRSALVAAADGLADLHRIIDEAPAHLRPGGWLLLEHGWDQATAVRQRMQQCGLDAIHSVRDLAGHERVTAGCARLLESAHAG